MSSEYISYTNFCTKVTANVLRDKESLCTCSYYKLMVYSINVIQSSDNLGKGYLQQPFGKFLSRNNLIKSSLVNF
jgi:hypothetical protein